MYIDNKPTSTVSNVLGTICGSLSTFIESKFPKNFFKHKYINTKLISVLRQRKDRQIIGFKTPSISYTPNTMNNDYFMQNSELNTIYTYTLLESTPDKLKLVTEFDRIRLNFDIKIKVNTRLKAVDVLKWLETSFIFSGPFELDEIQFESPIPNSVISLIAGNQDLPKDPENLSTLIAFMNKYSTRTTFFKKVNTSTKRINTFFLYSSNMICQFDGVPTIDYGQKNNLYTENYINFSIVVETWYPTNFKLYDEKLQQTLNTYINNLDPDDKTNLINTIGSDIDNLTYNDFVEILDIIEKYKLTMKYYDTTKISFDPMTGITEIYNFKTKQKEIYYTIFQDLIVEETNGDFVYYNPTLTTELIFRSVGKPARDLINYYDYNLKVNALYNPLTGVTTFPEKLILGINYNNKQTFYFEEGVNIIDGIYYHPVTGIECYPKDGIILYYDPIIKASMSYNITTNTTSVIEYYEKVTENISDVNDLNKVGYSILIDAPTRFLDQTSGFICQMQYSSSRKLDYIYFMNKTSEPSDDSALNKLFKEINLHQINDLDNYDDTSEDTNIKYIVETLTTNNYESLIGTKLNTTPEVEYLFIATDEIDYNEILLSIYKRNLAGLAYSTIKDEDTNIGFSLNFSIFNTPPTNIDNGMKLFYYTSFNSEFNSIIDRLDLSDEFTYEQKEVIRRYILMNKNSDNLFQVRLYSNDSEVDSHDYKIDWRTFQLVILNPKINTTYYLVIYYSEILYNRFVEIVFN